MGIRTPGKASSALSLHALEDGALTALLLPGPQLLRGEPASRNLFCSGPGLGLGSLDRPLAAWWAIRNLLQGDLTEDP